MSHWTAFYKSLGVQLVQAPGPLKRLRRPPGVAQQKPYARSNTAPLRVAPPARKRSHGKPLAVPPAAATPREGRKSFDVELGATAVARPTASFWSGPDSTAVELDPNDPCGCGHDFVLKPRAGANPPSGVSREADHHCDGGAAAQDVRSGPLSPVQVQDAAPDVPRRAEVPRLSPGDRGGGLSSFERTIEQLDAAAAARLAGVDLSVPNPDAKRPAIEALKADTPPGCCVGCDEPLTKPSKRFLCGDPECLEVYRAAWYSERSRHEREARAAGKPPPPPTTTDRQIQLEQLAEFA